MIRRPQRFTLFPYTTLFRANLRKADIRRCARGCDAEGQGQPGPCEEEGSDYSHHGTCSPALTRSSWPTHACLAAAQRASLGLDRKSTRLNSSHANISYAVFC